MFQLIGRSGEDGARDLKVISETGSVGKEPCVHGPDGQTQDQKRRSSSGPDQVVDQGATASESS